MLTLEDCIALCELTEDEVQAIARHERIPPIAAAELGNYLLRTPTGKLCVKDMLREDFAAAVARGDKERTLALKLLLREFVGRYPACESRRHPRSNP
jgi:hypothetical protein